MIISVSVQGPSKGWGLNPDFQYTRQAPCPLYYLSAPHKSTFLNCVSQRLIIKRCRITHYRFCLKRMIKYINLYTKEYKISLYLTIIWMKLVCYVIPLIWILSSSSRSWNRLTSLCLCLFVYLCLLVIFGHLKQIKTSPNFYHLILFLWGAFPSLLSIQRPAAQAWRFYSRAKKCSETWIYGCWRLSGSIWFLRGIIQWQVCIQDLHLEGIHTIPLNYIPDSIVSFLVVFLEKYQ